MQPLDRDSNTHARAQVLAVFSRARRVGKKKKKGRTDRTNREQIAKTTNFHWPDRQRQIDAKSECTDFFFFLGEGGVERNGEILLHRCWNVLALEFGPFMQQEKGGPRHQRPLNQTQRVETAASER